MKIIFALLLAQTLTMGIANAQKARPAAPKKTSEQKTCDRLLQLAQDECTEIMCSEYADENGDCEQDGDFAEGHQICVYDDVLPSMIQDHNERHPKKTVTCQDL